MKLPLRAMLAFVSFTVALPVAFAVGGPFVGIQLDHDESVLAFQNCTFRSPEERDCVYGAVCSHDLVNNNDNAWTLWLADSFCSQMWFGNQALDWDEAADCLLAECKHEYLGGVDPETLTPDPCSYEPASGRLDLGEGVYQGYGSNGASVVHPDTQAVDLVQWDIGPWDFDNIPEDYVKYCDFTIPVPPATECIENCDDFFVRVVTNPNARGAWGGAGGACPLDTCTGNCTQHWELAGSLTNAAGEIPQDRCLYDSSGCVTGLSSLANPYCVSVPGCDSQFTFNGGTFPGTCDACN